MLPVFSAQFPLLLFLLAIADLLASFVELG
jgi:hypothetical protein